MLAILSRNNPLEAGAVVSQGKDFRERTGIWMQVVFGEWSSRCSRYCNAVFKANRYGINIKPENKTGI